MEKAEILEVGQIIEGKFHPSKLPFEVKEGSSSDGIYIDYIFGPAVETTYINAAKINFFSGRDTVGETYIRSIEPILLAPGETWGVRMR